MKTATLKCPLAGAVVAPGDTVFRLTEDVTTIRLGALLNQSDDLIVTSRAGTVQAEPGNKLWVKGRQKRYIPAVDDLVVGVVTETHGESFAVDIGAPSKATLNALNFEGATRRNRPDIREGGLVYCKVETASRDVDATLTCVDSATGKAQGMGHLVGGFCVQVIAALSRHFPFEFAVGINGRIWVQAASVREVITVTTALQNSEFLSPAQVHIMVDELIRSASAK